VIFNEISVERHGQLQGMKYKQLLDEVFKIPRIIKVEVWVLGAPERSAIKPCPSFDTG